MKRYLRIFDFNKSFPSITLLHPHRSKMQPMPKSLVLQGFFGFLGSFFDLFFATISEPYGLEPVTFSCHALRDKFPCSVGRHLVQNMI